jgi:hypothetical protein
MLSLHPQGQRIRQASNQQVQAASICLLGPENGGTKFLQNVSILLPDYMVHIPRIAMSIVTTIKNSDPFQ